MWPKPFKMKSKRSINNVKLCKKEKMHGAYCMDIFFFKKKLLYELLSFFSFYVFNKSIFSMISTLPPAQNTRACSVAENVPMLVN